MLPGTHPGGSVETVLGERVRQVKKFGHTAAADAEKPLDFFIREVAAAGRGVADDFTCSALNPESLTRIRKRLARQGALTLAAIDRLDVELAALARDPEPPL